MNGEFVFNEILYKEDDGPLLAVKFHRECFDDVVTKNERHHHQA